jgi:hypothetical protein
MDDILKTAKDEVALFSDKDILVLWAGANDISKNNCNEALRSLIKCMDEHKKVNIILLHAQHRHDLMYTSCVNKEVAKFNRKTKKIIKLYPNARLMEIQLQRQHFTRHGQPLNLVGKELVAIEMVIGDSHARGCAAELIEHIGKSCEVVGFVKPRTGLEVITEMATKEISKLTNKDVVVVWGGTHDIAKNETKKGLEHLVKFVRQNSHTNIVIMEAPHRHDLSDLSCVNNEVKGFNRKLHKMMKIYDNAESLEVDVNRKHYTHHGLHMNISGKEKMAKKYQMSKKLLQERRKNLLP